MVTTFSLWLTLFCHIFLKIQKGEIFWNFIQTFIKTRLVHRILKKKKFRIDQQQTLISYHNFARLNTIQIKGERLNKEKIKLYVWFSLNYRLFLKLKN